MINMLHLFHLEKRNVPNNPISRCVSFRNNYKNRAPKNRGFVSSHFFGFDCFPNTEKKKKKEPKKKKTAYDSYMNPEPGFRAGPGDYYDAA